jgi:hypothetical protein
MVNQNILKYYGSKLDIKLDTSQLYDFQLGETYNDYDSRLLYVSSNDSISYESEVIDSDCLNSISTPIIFDVNANQDPDSCDFLIRRRTERGWTLDFIFNRNNNPWSVNNTFYYLGIFEETESNNYLDNNLYDEDLNLLPDSIEFIGLPSYFNKKIVKIPKSLKIIEYKDYYYFADAYEKNIEVKRCWNKN